MSKFIDLTGQKFGKLTVIEKAENKGGRTAWRCACECGNETIVSSTGLKGGNTKSCGCLRKDKVVDITGMRFGKLVALQQIPDTQNNQRKNRAKRWLFQCDCGNKTIASGSMVRQGHTKSCGCQWRKAQLAYIESLPEGDRYVIDAELHNVQKTRLYGVWVNMKTRCYNPKSDDYKNYGARGINVCGLWRFNFLAFREWALKTGYNENEKHGECTLDRIDIDGDYCPENCRWVNAKAQANNKRNNVTITYNGENRTVAEWAVILGIKETTIRGRLNRGWSGEEALNTPTLKTWSRAKRK